MMMMTMLMIDTMECARLAISEWTRLNNGAPTGGEAGHCEAFQSGATTTTTRRRTTTTTTSSQHEDSDKQSRASQESRTTEVEFNQSPRAINQVTQSIKPRSHQATIEATRPTSGLPLLVAWHRKQLIAGHALCLLLLIVVAGAGTIECQQQSNASSRPTTTTPTSGVAVSETSTTTPRPPPIDDQIEPTQSPSAGQQQATKLKPINFTLVDELFTSALEDDEELVKRWRNMDAQFQEGIRSILKLVFPQIVAISQDAKVSGDCSGGILKWILSLRNLRSWAIKMLDATGKPTAGIFEGSLTMFGNHRQCLAIRAPDEDEIEITDQFEEYFRGQFCVLHMRPWLGTKARFYNLNSTIEPLLRKNYKYYEKTLYDELAEIAIAFNFVDIRMDLCVPSTCTMADIQRVADLLSKKLEMRAKVMRCDIESRDASSSFVQNLDQVTLYWLTMPCGSIVLTLVATLLALLGLAKRKRSSKLALLVYNLSLQGACRSLTKCSPPTLGTSHWSNARDDGIHNTSNSGPSFRERILRKPLPLYGLRNIFIIWFVIVQLTVELNYQYLRESLVLRNMMLSYWPFQIIINTSMIFESLILITAFTYAYANLESRPRHLVAYIGQKYLRLVPSIVTLIMITIVTPNIGLTSPVWKNFVERQAQVCKSTGYLDLFFLQNFIAYDKICLPHTWLFCVEFQLILLTIPLVLLLKKTFTHNEDLIIIGRTQAANFGKPHHVSATEVDGQQPGQLSLASSSSPLSSAHQFRTTLVHLLCKSKAGLIGAALLIIGATLNFTLVYTNQLPPTWFHTFPDPDQKSQYFGKYLTKAWTHLTTFVIGLYAGYLCRAAIQLMDQHHSSPTNGGGQAWDQKSGRVELAFMGNKCAASSNTTITNSELEQRSSSNNRSNRSSGDSSSVTCNNSRFVLELAALVCLLAIIFGTFSWSTSELPSPLVSALYDSLARLVWSLALASLMIKLCIPSSSSTTGRLLEYSRLSAVLSHPFCLLLGRLSFLAYLIGPYVHTLVLALQEQSLFPSLYLIFHVILGNIVITYTVALLVSLLIEQPIKLVVGQLCCCLVNGGSARRHHHQHDQHGHHLADACGGSGESTTDVSTNVTTATSEASLAGAASGL